MQIYRNNICVKLGLEEFLDCLESDLFDELLLLIIGLDDRMPDNALNLAKPLEGSLSDEDGVHVEYIVQDVGELVHLFSDVLQGKGEMEISYYDYDEEYEPSIDGGGQTFYDNDISSTREDQKIRRILNRYRGMVE